MKSFTRFQAQAVATLIALAALAAPVAAQNSQTPATLAGGKVISVDEGRTLLDGKKAIFLDTRSAVNFGKGHVPSAVLVAYREKSAKVEGFDASQDQFDMTKLPADKSATIVIYSDGPTGWKSYKASVLAVKAGYKSVHYMRGGFAEWTAKGFPSAQ